MMQRHPDSEKMVNDQAFKKRDMQQAFKSKHHGNAKATAQDGDRQAFAGDKIKIGRKQKRSAKDKSKGDDAQRKAGNPQYDRPFRAGNDWLVFISAAMRSDLDDELREAEDEAGQSDEQRHHGGFVREEKRLHNEEDKQHHHRQAGHDAPIHGHAGTALRRVRAMYKAIVTTMIERRTRDRGRKRKPGPHKAIDLWKESSAIGPSTMPITKGGRGQSYFLNSQPSAPRPSTRTKFCQAPAPR